MTFEKRDTNIVKGVAILALFWHHLFSTPEFDTQFGVRFLVPQHAAVAFALMAKVCVAMFVLLTAYGLTVQLRGAMARGVWGGAQTARFCARRWLLLESEFLFVYLVTVLLSAFTAHSPAAVYGGGPAAPVYGLADALGLSALFGTPTMDGAWWYMTLAAGLTVFVPAAVLLWNKMGAALLALALFLPAVLDADPTANGFPAYAFAMAVGVWCAEDNVFVRVKTFAQGSKARYAACAAGSVLLCAALALGRIVLPAAFLPFLDGALALAAACACFLCFSGNVVGGALAFLGRHSGNMYFLHQLFITYQLQALCYAPRYPVLILALVTALTLAAALAVEALKKLTHWNTLRDALVRRVTAGGA